MRWPGDPRPASFRTAASSPETAPASRPDEARSPRRPAPAAAPASTGRRRRSRVRRPSRRAARARRPAPHRPPCEPECARHRACIRTTLRQAPRAPRSYLPLNRPASVAPAASASARTPPDRLPLHRARRTPPGRDHRPASPRAGSAAPGCRRHARRLRSARLRAPPAGARRKGDGTGSPVRRRSRRPSTHGAAAPGRHPSRHRRSTTSDRTARPRRAGRAAIGPPAPRRVRSIVRRCQLSSGPDAVPR